MPWWQNTKQFYVSMCTHSPTFSFEFYTNIFFFFNFTNLWVLKAWGSMASDKSFEIRQAWSESGSTSCVILRTSPYIIKPQFLHLQNRNSNRESYRYNVARTWCRQSLVQWINDAHHCASRIIFSTKALSQKPSWGSYSLLQLHCQQLGPSQTGATQGQFPGIQRS